ncbi:MAG: hypothetical protein IJF87_00400 [Erysipelotrichaceae bacterium]|nr:hypothetical protein [Erysipelotrichaceae bacterium]
MTGQYYVFIIWNKALFCKDRILNDLKSSFRVEKGFYIKWKKEHFLDDLRAFYGVKSPDVRQKRSYIGEGLFYVTLVYDEIPTFGRRKTYNGYELINEKVYDKKWLYRKWTGGNFRIHCSQDEQETKHDLTVLLGSNYSEKISNIEWESILEEDTSGFQDFHSVDALSDVLKLFDGSAVLHDNESIFVFSKCRSNIVFFLKCKRITDWHYIISINGKEYDLYLYGEEEGDIPEGFYEKIGKNPGLMEDFLNIQIDYGAFLENRLCLTEKINDFFLQNGFSGNLIRKNPMRIENRIGVFKRIKDYLKYCYLFFKEKKTYENENKNR